MKEGKSGPKPDSTYNYGGIKNVTNVKCRHHA